MERTLDTLRELIRTPNNPAGEDLASHLILALDADREAIKRFGSQNMLFDARNNDELRLLKSASCYLAAGYFANARYLDMPVCEERERIVFSARNWKGGAFHEAMGPHRHRIGIPPVELQDDAFLLPCIDSETRHAIHYNILSDYGLELPNLAQRAFHGLTEIVDDASTWPTAERNVMMADDIDPYLNDFEMDLEDDGHSVSAGYLEHLSLNAAERRQQVRWIARLPVRSAPTDTEVYRTFMALNLRLNNDSLEHLPSREGGVPLAILRGGLFTERNGMQPLIDFYSGAKAHNTETSIAWTLRTFALMHLPYAVPPKIGVQIKGRLVTRFASQLDYAALKLALEPAQKLQEEADMIYRANCIRA